MIRVRFHIIVVSYNPGERLRNTLESIYAQDYRDYDVVIEDSESDDGSLSTLRDRGFFDEKLREERTKIYSEKDKGIYDGMNLAVSRIGRSENNAEETREYVLFLNCGDRFHDKQVLGAIADHIAEEKEDRLCIFYGDQFDLLRGTVVSSNRKLNEFALYRNVPCHQVCFYDLRLFDERGYDTKYRVRADYEHFLYCIYKRNAAAEYVNVIVSDYEGDGYSESEEGRKLSQEEHDSITHEYMGRNADKYKWRLILTGSGIRTKLAGNPKFSGTYNKIKSFVYSRK
ncbi:MAG: glycosyltransferase [Lachnospiraceae bacterium]|nr:glycosyltransferase [Lachnospiraceae bacterium]